MQTSLRIFILILLLSNIILLDSTAQNPPKQCGEWITSFKPSKLDIHIIDSTKFTTYENLQLHLDFARCLINNSDLFYEEGVSILDHLLALTPNLTASDSTTLLLKKGVFFLYQNKETQALLFLEQAQQIYKSNHIQEDSLLTSIYYNTSKCLFRQRDLEKAMSYIKKAISIQEPLNYIKLPAYYEYAARINIMQKKYSQAEAYLLKAIDFYTQNQLEAESKHVYVLLGDIECKQEHFKKARQHYFHALDIVMQYPSLYNPSSMATIYDRIGNAYYLASESEDAIKYYNLYIGINGLNNKFPPKRIANTYSKIGASYTKLKQFDLADQNIDKALNLVEFDRNATNSFKKWDNKIDLLRIIYFKAKNQLKRYESNNEISDLKEAYEWYSICLDIIDYVTQNISVGSRSYLLDEFYYIYESMLQVCWHFVHNEQQPSYIDEALMYIEKSHNVILRSTLQEAKAKVLADLPDSLINQHQTYLQQLQSIKQQQYEASKKRDQSLVLQLDGEYFDKERAFEKFQQNIFSNFPIYQQSLQRNHVLTLPETRSSILRPNEALLQYFVGDDDVYLILVSHNVKKLIRLGKSTDLQEKITAFSANITLANNPSYSATHKVEYHQLAHELYLFLLAPATDFLDKKLLIIPDGLLEAFPFEAMLTKSASPTSNWEELPYVIHDYQIRYSLGLSLLKHTLSPLPTTRTTNKVLVFSPTFFDKSHKMVRDNYQTLFYGQKEAQNIADTYQSLFMQGTQATATNFVQNATDFDFIHLSTHANATYDNDELPHLIFSSTLDSTDKEKLFASDISSMTIPAQLAVLSACQTGIGQWNRGEGLASLTRSFFYAGTRSLLSSFWSIDDKRTMELVLGFYQSLNPSIEKDAALRDTKINYIQEHKNINAHPYFWSSLSIHGNMESINIPSKEKSTTFAWLFIFLPFVLWFTYKYTKRI